MISDDDDSLLTRYCYDFGLIDVLAKSITYMGVCNIQIDVCDNYATLYVNQFGGRARNALEGLRARLAVNFRYKRIERTLLLRSEFIFMSEAAPIASACNKMHRDRIGLLGRVGCTRIESRDYRRVYAAIRFRFCCCREMDSPEVLENVPVDDSFGNDEYGYSF